jgi:hypothetical protein
VPDPDFIIDTATAIARSATGADYDGWLLGAIHSNKCTLPEFLHELHAPFGHLLIFFSFRLSPRPAFGKI